MNAITPPPGGFGRDVETVGPFRIRKRDDGAYGVGRIIDGAWNGRRFPTYQEARRWADDMVIRRERDASLEIAARQAPGADGWSYISSERYAVYGDPSLGYNWRHIFERTGTFDRLPGYDNRPGRTWRATVRREILHVPGYDRGSSMDFPQHATVTATDG